MAELLNGWAKADEFFVSSSGFKIGSYEQFYPVGDAIVETEEQHFIFY